MNIKFNFEDHQTGEKVFSVLRVEPNGFAVYADVEPYEIAHFIRNMNQIVYFNLN